MKDIIAALEAKRAAGLRSEERHAAGHAKGEFTPVLRALALVAGLFLMGQGGALSQEMGQHWTSSDRAFGVTIPAGWRQIDEFVSGPFLLAIGPAPQTAERERQDREVCSVEGRPISTAPMNQGRINELMDRLLEQLPSELRATTVHASSSDTLRGVRVISVDIDRQGLDGAPTRQMQRMFAVPTASGMMHYQIGCGASGSAYSTADTAAMQGFVASLTLTAEATP